MNYANVEQLRQYLPAVSDADETALESIITRASRAIDAYCRRDAGEFAGTASEGTERVLYGTGAPRMDIPAYVPKSVSAVSGLNDSPVMFREYRGGLVTTDERGVWTPHVQFRKGVPYKVTARWGYEATPADITEACLQLATRWWRAKDEGFSGAIGAITTGGSIIERGFPPGVKTLLEPYVLIEREDEEDGLIEQGNLNTTDFNPGGMGWY
ncbi:MAG: hypothetical protein MSG64_16685 [Pyrinomonadaceae bacterium MAG19_C2-C3]|nr:hypothetical protein [Pyrinomonadaceae bacterium MAG19_C2-C3]